MIWDDRPRSRWELLEAIEEEEFILADGPGEFLTLHKLQLEQLVMERDGCWRFTDCGKAYFLRVQPTQPALWDTAEVA